MLVTAGPGSGKTFVLTGRILYLIGKRYIPPGKILVITFTREAAGSMQARFYQMSKRMGIYDPDGGQVCFGTFHSFFYQIIKSVPSYKEYQILSKQEAYRMLLPILQRFLPGEDCSGEEIHQRFLSAVSLYQNTENLQSACDRFSDQGERENFPEILRIYQAEKERRKRLDYDDMLTLCHRILSSDGASRTYWQKRFSHILIDEFQDCNPVQYRVIRLLCARSCNLFAVGDDDQAIYGFRGADPGIMQAFLRDYQDAERVTLGVNYRCNRSIVEASSRVIQENKQRLPKQLRAWERGTTETDSGTMDSIETAGVRIKSFSARREEVSDLIERLRRKSPWELDDEAILFRTNAELQFWVVELFKNRIPYVMRERSKSVYQHFITRDVMDYFRAAHGRRERDRMLRLFHRPKLHISREALREPEVDFDRLREYYRLSGAEDRKTLQDITRFEHQLERLRGMRLSLGVAFIRHAFGYDRYLRQRAGGSQELLEDWERLFVWLTEDAENFESFGEWEKYQEEYEESNARKREETAGKRGIHILTMHGAKGLEFQKVYLPGINEGNVPRYRRGEELSAERLEEERRLFYVAMTRAKNALEISFQTGTEARPMYPSRFLQKLKSK